jgi:hypothetical protein
VGFAAVTAAGRYVDVLFPRKSLKGTGMMDPGVTMNREEIAAFLASLKKLRDGLDDFNCNLAAIDGAGMRLGMLCQETATACLAAAVAIAQGLAGKPSLAYARHRSSHLFEALNRR